MRFTCSLYSNIYEEQLPRSKLCASPSPHCNGKYCCVELCPLTPSQMRSKAYPAAIQRESTSQLPHEGHKYTPVQVWSHHGRYSLSSAAALYPRATIVTAKSTPPSNTSCCNDGGRAGRSSPETSRMLVEKSLFQKLVDVARISQRHFSHLFR